MIHHIGVHLRKSVTVGGEFLFRNNRRFRFKPSPRACNYVTPEYRIRFTSDDSPRDTYNLYFGPSFGNSSVVYTTDNLGLGLGIERLTCVRQPELHGSDEQLWESHAKFCSSPWAQAVALFWRQKYIDYSHVDYYEDLLRQHALDRRHVKFKLRRAALMQMYETHGLFADWGPGFNSAKMKPGEDAKVKKKPRTIVDLQTIASLVAGFILDDLKNAIDCDQFYDVCGLRVCIRFYKSPSYDNMSQAFRRLSTSDVDGLCCDYFFAIFSDDMCVRGPGDFMANIDISQCDSSHGDELFGLLRSTIDVGWYDHAVDGVFAQCKRPLTVWDTSHTQKVTLTPLHHTLFSGSTLTTAINTLASTLICVAIVAWCRNTPSRLGVILGARQAGYVVTVDLCPTYHHLQFLKHSPCVDECGVLVPILNLGVLLRAIGRCKGRQLPKGFTYSNFNSALVRGFVHAGDHAFTLYLRARYCDDVPAYTERYFQMDAHGGFVHTAEMCVRYGLHPSEFDTMIELHALAGCGDVVWSAASDAIFQKDYGY